MAGRQVYRTIVELVDGDRAVIDLTGPVLLVGTRYEDKVEIWHLHNEGHPPRPTEFVVAGTGHELPDDAGEHVGSVITPSGRSVWHVFRCR